MTTRAQRAVAIVDLGFGDAGKGLVTDALVRSLGAHTVVRFNGGAQAGHNVVLEDGRHHTFAQFGAGTFVPGVATFLSRFVALHPTAALVEAARLARLGVSAPLSRLSVDARARVTTPFHQAANRLRELARGANRHGSCGIGFGETIADAEAGHAIVAGDLRHRDGGTSRLRARLRAMQERKRAELTSVLQALPRAPDVERERAILEAPVVIEAWLDRVAAFSAEVRVLGPDAESALLAREGAVVFEGAQGVLLDEWFGFHPHTTWSTCTFANAKALLAEHDYQGELTRVGVSRTYAVRHGAGPLPTADAALEAALPEPHNVLGPWQGNVRRGWPDLVLHRYALAVTGGIDALALTHADALPRLAPTGYRVCTQYRDDDAGSSIDALDVRPAPDLAHQEKLTRTLARVTPRYEAMAADDASVIARFERESRAPVTVVSRGPRACDVEYRGVLGVLGAR